MISRLGGILVDLNKDAGQVRVSPGIDIEVLLPVFASSRLAVSLGQPVELHTLLFIESQNQGAVLLPRLAGFASPDDRSLYQLLVTVKGIGHRRALRAMVMDAPRLAAAILERDVKLLQTMPEVGKKTAETIVITLQDKVERFVSSATVARDGDATAPAGASSMAGATSVARDAVEALVALGEARLDAVDRVDRVMRGESPPTTVEETIAAVYQRRG